jgi:hypothetical protein
VAKGDRLAFGLSDGPMPGLPPPETLAAKQGTTAGDSPPPRRARRPDRPASREHVTPYSPRRMLDLPVEHEPRDVAQQVDRLAVASRSCSWTPIIGALKRRSAGELTFDTQFCQKGLDRAPQAGPNMF